MISAPGLLLVSLLAQAPSPDTSEAPDGALSLTLVGDATGFDGISESDRFVTVISSESPLPSTRIACRASYFQGQLSGPCRYSRVISFGCRADTVHGCCQPWP